MSGMFCTDCGHGLQSAYMHSCPAPKWCGECGGKVYPEYEGHRAECMVDRHTMSLPCACAACESIRPVFNLHHHHGLGV